MGRFVLGEGIEKRSADLAKEVEAQTKAFEEAAAKKAAEASAEAAPAQAAADAPAAPEVSNPLVRSWFKSCICSTLLDSACGYSPDT